MKLRILDPGTHARTVSVALLVMRVSIALMMILGHGWGKLAHLGDRPTHFPDPLGIGPTMSLACTIGAEVVCAALVAIGLATRLAALALVFTMGVAAFVVNGGQPWGEKELAVLYLVPFLALLMTGAGAYSIDATLYRGTTPR